MVERLRATGSEHLELPVGDKWLSAWSCRTRLRQVFEREEPTVVHARSRLPAWIAWHALSRLPPYRRPAFVTTVHGFYSVSRYSAIMTRGDRVIAVSQSAKDYVVENYPHVDAAAIEVIYRGVDTDVYHPETKPSARWMADWYEAYPQLLNRKVLTLPGRITRIKGHRAFIDIIATLRASGFDVTGLVVGGDEPQRQRYADEIRRYVAAKGLDGHCLFTGHRDDLREILSISDIVFSLSEKPESFGRTTLEALRLGIPVVGYAHGGVAEILSEMFPEGAVPPGHVAAAVERARSVLAKKTTPRMSARFSLMSSLAQELAVYGDLAASRQRS
jgi:glycosyltransferase involved in cell wall biosynthesis